jgi:hypothetical protein
MPNWPDTPIPRPLHPRRPLRPPMPIDKTADVETGDHGHPYRYTLSRIWDRTKPLIAWCMLNPSIADETIDDPTIDKCLRYTWAWDYGGFTVVNLFALVHTYPNQLTKFGYDHLVGPRNDEALTNLATDTEFVICGWGTHKIADIRVPAVMNILNRNYQPPDIRALAVNSAGSPRHPLYMSAAALPVAYRPKPGYSTTDR